MFDARPAKRNLSDEFRLVVACCTWPASELRNAAIRAAAQRPIDWQLFLRIVERQRVGGLVHDGLVRAGIALPLDIAARLASGATAIARESLTLALEAARLQDLIDGAGIAAAFLKGTSLAMLAYGNIAIKHAWDIDLLVPRADLPQAMTVLRDAGYERVLPPPHFSDRQFLAWTAFAHEALFRHATRGMAVELHWRLAETDGYGPEFATGRPSRRVEIVPGRTLATLGDDDLFSYLCMHGAHHAWSRLKWLADLAAWLATKTPEETARLYRAAKIRGTGRAPDQALLLCEQLFHLTLPQDLEPIRKSRVTRWLAAIAWDAMAGGRGRQVEDRTLGNLPIELSQFLLADSFGGWLHAWRSKAVGWNDYLRLPLPRPLFFLYPLLRVPSWIWRRGVYLVRRHGAVSRSSGP